MNFYIGTATGGKIDVFHPSPEDIRIEDIAHALSHTARFGGHTRWFYSVAMHSWEVSRRCDPEDALWGLLHDAAEAYIGDLPQPIKQHPTMAPYRGIERRLLHAIADRFGLPRGIPESVKVADAVELVTEADQLFDEVPDEWHLKMGVTPREGALADLPPRWAKDWFLSRYQQLARTRGAA